MHYYQVFRFLTIHIYLVFSIPVSDGTPRAPGETRSGEVGEARDQVGGEAGRAAQARAAVGR